MTTLIAKIVLFIMLTLSLTGTSLCTNVDTSSAETKREQKDTIVFKLEQMKPYDQVLYYTKLYAKKYSVPEVYLFRLLKTETGFRASDTTYNPFCKRILRTIWDGPYQMLTSTARSVWPDTLKNLTKKEFRKKMRFDLNFSTETAVKYIHQLHEKYKTWIITFSVYNQGPSGQHRVNRYATRIVKGS